MLVLTRKRRESILIDAPQNPPAKLKITILKICGGRVLLGFESDLATKVHRWEVWEKIHRQDECD